ncbi:hypothetical protein CYMTET_8741 [Cymbomonas tetramitiformis]|uniref:Acyltransferase 3 domain-containing protein n=1 Tax=Cymbomonas tetramitiformis TaxID=36881 RepID=A0AAE0GT55_9CHLO|nr:hypothetical protein CYMTET_8741 [Cymbomonas tetramitiformis]
MPRAMEGAPAPFEVQVPNAAASRSGPGPSTIEIGEDDDPMLRFSTRSSKQLQRRSDIIVLAGLLMALVGSHCGLLLCAPHAQPEAATRLDARAWWYAVFAVCLGGVLLVVLYLVRNGGPPSDIEEDNDVGGVTRETRKSVSARSGPPFGMSDYQTLPASDAESSKLQSDKQFYTSLWGMRLASWLGRLGVSFEDDTEDEAVAAPQYDYRFDNAKYFMTQVVALTHFYYYWNKNGNFPDFFSVSDFWKESFVMVVYAFVSGYLSTGALNNVRAQRFFTKLAFSYVSMQVFFLVVFEQAYDQIGYTEFLVFFVANSYTHFRKFIFQVFFAPYFHLWYLLALIQWRLLTPYWLQLRYPVVSALVLYVLVSYSQPDGSLNYFLCYGRTFGHFPIYILGTQMKSVGRLNESFLRIFRRWEARYMAWTGLVLHYWFVWYNHCGEGQGCDLFLLKPKDSKTIWSESWVVFNTKLSRDRPGYELAWVSLLFTYGVMLIPALCVFAVVPSRKVWFTEMGSRSMSNYIFHVLLALVWSYTGIYEYSSTWRYILNFLVAIAVSHFLMLKVVWDHFSKWLMFPPCDFIMAPLNPK